ncbi:hypothetical protein C1H76_2856 [Elsinoe australis]|uniref:Uncharacterized protein n=1 Tax=Elsinoe australis TaxID=40998 RepID=A0A4U7B1D5_9PEZI|nr:hypothetical protein C1H76_2856 [Elsinoe australis]
MESSPQGTQDANFPTVALTSLLSPTQPTGAATIPVASATATPVSTPISSTATPSNSMSSGNVKPIIASSIVGGLVLIAFLAYVGFRLHRGDDIADVLKLRRRPQPIHLDDEALPSASLGEGVFIHRTQRFSVRSHRYPSRLSIYSTKSRRENARKSTATSKLPPDSPYKQYSDQYLIRPPTTKRPSVSRTVTEPVPKIKDYPTTPDSGKVMHSFLFNASTDTGLVKPEMAQLRSESSGSSSPMTPTTPHGAPEVLTRPTSMANRRVTIIERPVTAPNGGTKRKSSRFTEEDKERWSWTNSEAPATPKFKLERAPSTDPYGPRVVMERIDEDHTPATRTTSHHSARKLSAGREKDVEKVLKSALRTSEVPAEGKKGKRLSKAAQQHNHARVPSFTQIIRNLSQGEKKGDEEVMLTERKPSK